MKSILLGLAVLGVIVIPFIYLNRSANQSIESQAGEPKIEHVHGLAVDVSDPGRLLIATHHGLLELKNNSLAYIGTAKDDFMGFIPHPVDGSTYFRSGHPSAGGGNLGFQKSTDGGVTWSKIADGLNGPVDFHIMTVSTANADVFYGVFGKLQRSRDGGNTWEFTKESIQAYSLATHPRKENVVYAATQNGVKVSEDYGDSWSNLSPDLGSGAVSVFALAPDGTEALVYSQKLGGLGKSSDEGKTWRKVTGSFGNSAVLFLSYSKAEQSIVYAMTQANKIFKSDDRGESWEEYH